MKERQEKLKLETLLQNGHTSNDVVVILLDGTINFPTP